MKKLIRLTTILLSLAIVLNSASCNLKRNRNPNIKPIQFRLVKKGAENIFTQKDPSLDYLEETVLMSEKDISGLISSVDPLGRPAIIIHLTDEGTKTFSDITKNSIGRIIAVVHDERVIFSPKIMEHIKDGEIQVSGSFTQNQIDNLVKSMRTDM